MACRNCRSLRRERLRSFADSPFETKPFAFSVGQRCRSAASRALARELELARKTFKGVEKQYMRVRLWRAPKPPLPVIGVEEIAIRKRRIYCIVVSALKRERAIWFGGADRAEATMDQVLVELGAKKIERIRLALTHCGRCFATPPHAMPRRPAPCSTSFT